MVEPGESTQDEVRIPLERRSARRAAVLAALTTLTLGAFASWAAKPSAAPALTAASALLGAAVGVVVQRSVSSRIAAGMYDVVIDGRAGVVRFPPFGDRTEVLALERGAIVSFVTYVEVCTNREGEIADAFRLCVGARDPARRGKAVDIPVRVFESAREAEELAAAIVREAGLPATTLAPLARPPAGLEPAAGIDGEPEGEDPATS